jgi:hypothetical protein
MYYCFDKVTGKRASLNTTNEDAAQQIIEAKNQAVRQPTINLQIAQASQTTSRRGDERIASLRVAPI